MKIFLHLLFILWLISGCSIKTENYTLAPHSISSGMAVSYDSIQHWKEDDLSKSLLMFKDQCQQNRVPESLQPVCKKAESADDARMFFEHFFTPIALYDESGGESTGLMTGYYEPLLQGSLIKSERYRYPLYGVPDDLLNVQLESIRPELRGEKLRGRIEQGKIVSMPSRKEINERDINAPVICYVESEIDRFFLQVQGSGRVALDNGETIFVGYANENGHPYRSIGKFMIEMGYIEKEKISLQSIRTWLEDHPDERRTVLEHNPGFVFFAARDQGATGSLGLELSPLHSIAVDRSFIPLGMPVYYESVHPLSDKSLHNLALAQDTGGAIKGQVRADLFWGFGKEAEAKAGAMKSPLRLWMLVPKELIDGMSD